MLRKQQPKLEANVSSTVVGNGAVQPKFNFLHPFSSVRDIRNARTLKLGGVSKPSTPPDSNYDSLNECDGGFADDSFLPESLNVSDPETALDMKLREMQKRAGFRFYFVPGISIYLDGVLSRIRTEDPIDPIRRKLRQFGQDLRRDENPLDYAALAYNADPENSQYRI